MDKTVQVFEFEYFDKTSRAWKRCARRGTVEAITRIGGIAINSSALVVDASRLDPQGFVSEQAPG